MLIKLDVQFVIKFLNLILAAFINVNINLLVKKKKMVIKFIMIQKQEKLMEILLNIMNQKKEKEQNGLN